MVSQKDTILYMYDITQLLGNTLWSVNRVVLSATVDSTFCIFFLI